MSQTQEILTNLFAEKRIVIWYDAKQEFYDDFQTLNIDGVDKIEVNNNEFQVKYRILRKEKMRNFLLYVPYEQNNPEKNWLLDVELAYTAYRTDQVSQSLLELGWGNEFRLLVQEHQTFFSEKTRREKIKLDVDKQNDTNDTVRLKMLYAIAKSDPHFDLVLEKLYLELAQDKDSLYKQITRCKLDTFFWSKVKQTYNYSHDHPTVKGLFLTLFQYGYYNSIDPEKLGNTGLNKEAIIFLKQIKDKRGQEYREAFETFSELVYDYYSIQDDLIPREITTFGEIDLFRAIDEHLVSELSTRISARSISEVEVNDIIQKRKQSVWYEQFESQYQALVRAIRFFAMLNDLSFTASSAEQAFRCYTGNYYQLDQLYRQFNFLYQKAEQPESIQPLMQEIERRYLNDFVIPLNQNWQKQVDRMTEWKVSGILPQSSFFDTHVRHQVSPVGRKTPKKIFVIISDAFRYEAAEELSNRIRQDGRIKTELSPLFANLPSITRMGMAALLPHKKLHVQENEENNLITVKCDGASVQTLAQRESQLGIAGCGKGIAIDASSIMRMSRDEGRAWTKTANFFYIYQDIIDKRSHNEATEGDSFDAVDDAIEEIIKVVRKLITFNATQFFVTADHGFLFQNSDLEQNELLSVKPSGNVLEQKSRYAIGRNLSSQTGLRDFSTNQLDLEGQLQFQFPKGICRTPIQGVKGRFVHGGVSLQEVALPLLSLTYVRTNSQHNVGIEIFSSMTNIVSEIVTVSLFQTEPVGGEVQMQKTRVGLYSSLGPDRILLSEEQKLTFDKADEEPENRSMMRTFYLNQAASQFNNKNVWLIVESDDGGTLTGERIASKEFRLCRTIVDHDF